MVNIRGILLEGNNKNDINFCCTTKGNIMSTKWFVVSGVIYYLCNDDKLLKRIKKHSYRFDIKNLEIINIEICLYGQYKNFKKNNYIIVEFDGKDILFLKNEFKSTSYIRTDLRRF